jgi:hypothetical protein
MRVRIVAGAMLASEGRQDQHGPEQQAECPAVPQISVPSAKADQPDPGLAAEPSTARATQGSEPGEGRQSLASRILVACQGPTARWGSPEVFQRLILPVVPGHYRPPARLDTPTAARELLIQDAA